MSPLLRIERIIVQTELRLSRLIRLRDHLEFSAPTANRGPLLAYLREECAQHETAINGLFANRVALVAAAFVPLVKLVVPTYIVAPITRIVYCATS